MSHALLRATPIACALQGEQRVRRLDLRLASRFDIEQDKVLIPMKRIVVLNPKGGSGKTTT